VIVVNPATRQFNIPGADLVFGVTADANSAIKHFQCPRYVGNNVDIASSFVRINYQNAHGDIDFYLVKDVTIDGDNVTFSWELHPKVTMYKGNVSFVMCVTGPDMKVKWHTTLGRGQVLEGLEPDSTQVETETADGIAALIAMVEAQTEAVADTGAEWVRNVQFEGTDQIVAVQTAGAESKAAAVAEIEAKGKNVMESIPDDYTTLGNAVDGLVRGRAGAIVCEVEGSAVAVNDASDNYLQGLRIFGRSTQDSVPTPDNPVEIVSVDSPVVTVGGKNFFDVSAEVVPYSLPVQTIADDVITLDRTAGDIWGDWMPLVLKKGVPYTISVEFVEKETPSEGVTFRTSDIANKSGVDVTAIRLMYSVDGRVSYTFTPMKDTNYIQFYLQSSWSLDSKISFKNVQVEAGSVATAYEPYKQIQTVETTHSLRGIPVTTGGNYTDDRGQQWICDEVDLERCVLVRRVNKFVIDGNFTGNISRETEKEKTQVFLVVLPKPHPEKYRRDFFSNRFVSYVATDDAEKMVPNLNSVYVALNKERLTELSVVGFRAWVTDNPITMYYAQETPEEIPLSETEIAAYRALHTNKPNTAILNDSGAHMKVEYAADTKLYIDNKLAALVGNT
jgi:hypothetical protein